MSFAPPSAAPFRAATAARYAAARSTYTTDAVSTVTPAQLVVMVYDALVSHMDVAIRAIGDRDPAAAHERLVKAQALLFELEVGLDLSVWPAGAGLKQLYEYLGQELVSANVAKDAARVAACRDLVAPLAEAWREAARTAPAAGTTPTAQALSARS